MQLKTDHAATVPRSAATDLCFCLFDRPGGSTLKPTAVCVIGSKEANAREGWVRCRELWVGVRSRPRVCSGRFVRRPAQVEESGLEGERA